MPTTSDDYLDKDELLLILILVSQQLAKVSDVGRTTDRRRVAYDVQTCTSKTTKASI